MRGLFLTLLLLPLLFAAVPTSFGNAMAAAHLASMGDLPLPEGFQEIKDHAVTLEGAVGRVSVAYASGDLAAEDVHAFYDDALPKLGWEREAKGRYRRTHETLKIDALGGNGSPVTVSFTLSNESE